MSYPVPANSPNVTIDGRTIAVGAFDWSTPSGKCYKVGLFEKSKTGDWLEVVGVIEYKKPGDTLDDIKAKGGTVKYIQWLIAQLNAAFDKIFNLTPEFEPITDDEARAKITAAVTSMTVTIANNIPIVK